MHTRILYNGCWDNSDRNR